MSVPDILDVALVQTRTPSTPADALDHIAPLIREAAATGAQLILTPEGSNFLQQNRAKRAEILAGQDEDVAVIGMRELAQELRIWLLIGSAIVACEDDPGERRAANRSLLVDPHGEIRAAYDKLHVYDVDLPTGERHRESEAIRPGTRAVVAETPFGGLGLTICYDVRFPHLFRALARAGAEMIAVPAAFTVPTGEAHWEVLLRARAIEAGAFVLAPAQGGAHEDGRRTWGHSRVVDPWGRVIAAAEDDRPQVIAARLDLAAVGRARAAIAQLSHDREFTGPVIRYALQCDHDHGFEAWFSTSDDFDDQAAAGQVECPWCSSRAVRKAIMAPAVSGTRRAASASGAPAPDLHSMMMQAAEKMRAHVEQTFDYVGDRFAREARDIHEGASEARPIYGEATPTEVKALRADGVPVAPLPAAVTPKPKAQIN